MLLGDEIDRVILLTPGGLPALVGVVFVVVVGELDVSELVDGPMEMFNAFFIGFEDKREGEFGVGLMVVKRGRICSSSFPHSLMSCMVSSLGYSPSSS